MKGSIGIDCLSIARFRKLRGAARDRFLRRTFTAAERRYCERFSDPNPHFAGLFAAKEAVTKALGGRIALSSVEIIHDRRGQPSARVRGRRRPIAVSISHEGTFAIAAAITS